MVSKQKSIFDSDPVKVNPQIVQSKTNDETVPFEESIFAIKKKEPVIDKMVHEDEYVPIDDTIFYKGKLCCNEDDDDRFSSNDDEVSLDDSVFAKPKRLESSPVVIKSNSKKIDFDDLFNKYKDIYMNEYIYNKQRLNMIDANTFNVCCSNLELSLKTKVMNIEAYDIIKKIIKSSCTCSEEAIYCYTNMNKCLINLAHELNPNEDVYVIFHMIDRSYAEVINEFGGMKWQR